MATTTTNSKRTRGKYYSDEWQFFLSQFPRCGTNNPKPCWKENCNAGLTSKNMIYKHIIECHPEDCRDKSLCNSAKRSKSEELEVEPMNVVDGDYQIFLPDEIDSCKSKPNLTVKLLTAMESSLAKVYFF